MMKRTAAQLASQRVAVLWTNRQRVERLLDDAIAIDSPRLIAGLDRRIQRLDAALTEALRTEAVHFEAAHGHL